MTRAKLVGELVNHSGKGLSDLLRPYKDFQPVRRNGHVNHLPDHSFFLRFLCVLWSFFFCQRDFGSLLQPELLPFQPVLLETHFAKRCARFLDIVLEERPFRR